MLANRNVLLQELNDVDEDNCKFLAKALIYGDVPMADLMARCRELAGSGHGRDQAAGAYVAVCLAEVDNGLMDECAPIVAAACASGNVEVRRHAYRALEEANKLLGKVVKEVVGGVEDPDLEVRITAAGRVGEIGAKAKAAAPHLAMALTHKDERLRSAAAWSLGYLGKGALDALDALGSALQDPDYSARLNAADSLTRLGKKAAPAMPAILAALAEKDLATDVLIVAASKLSEDPGALAGPLLDLLESGPEDLRYIAAEHLGKLGVEGRAAVPALERALAGDDESLRYVAQIALRKIRK